jgi:hypothetical protein
MKLKSLISKLNALYDEHQSADVYLPGLVEINDVVVEAIDDVEKIIVLQCDGE